MFIFATYLHYTLSLFCWLPSVAGATSSNVDWTSAYSCWTSWYPPKKKKQCNAHRLTHSYFKYNQTWNQMTSELISLIHSSVTFSVTTCLSPSAAGSSATAMGSFAEVVVLVSTSATWILNGSIESLPNMDIILKIWELGYWKFSLTFDDSITLKEQRHIQNIKPISRPARL